MGRKILLYAALILITVAGIRAQQPEAADTSAGYYREYVNRLIDDWRLEQVRDFAQQWGMRVGGREFAVNRSFWEDRFNLSLSVGVPQGRLGQSLVMEYHIRPRLLVRGEFAHQPDRTETWVDFIFRTEY
jgi:hypothetical protein